jgi:hypothetical protein
VANRYLYSPGVTVEQSAAATLRSPRLGQLPKNSKRGWCLHPSRPIYAPVLEQLAGERCGHLRNVRFGVNEKPVWISDIRKARAA